MTSDGRAGQARPSAGRQPQVPFNCLVLIALRADRVWRAELTPGDAIIGSAILGLSVPERTMTVGYRRQFSKHHGSSSHWNAHLSIAAIFGAFAIVGFLLWSVSGEIETRPIYESTNTAVEGYTAVEG